MTTTYTTSTPARCNQCQAKFALAADAQGYEMGTTAAARLISFAACPECGAVDCHWVYKADLYRVKIETESAGRFYAKLLDRNDIVIGLSPVRYTAKGAELAGKELYAAA